MQQEFAQALVDEVPTWYAPMHRMGKDLAPHALTVVASVPLSIDDVTAMVWWQTSDWGPGMRDALLGSPPLMRSFLAESIVAAGGYEVVTARTEMGKVPADSAESQLVALIRSRMTALYGDR